MEKLKQYLRENKIKQIDFAKLLGVNPITMWRYLHCKRIPRIKVMQKITELTKGYITANDFFGEK